MSEGRIREFRAAREVAKRQMTVMERFLTEMTSKTNIDVVEAHLELLNAIKNRFETAQVELERIDSAETEEPEDEQLTERELFENRFIQVKARLRRILRESPNSSLNPLNDTTMSDLSTDIPNYLPDFHGDYTEYPIFMDLFETLVHSNNSGQMTNVRRMSILMNACKGRAYDVIKHLRLTDENYEVAKALLDDRFANPRLNFEECISRISDVPGVNKEILARSDFTKFLERRCTVWEAEDTVKPSVRNETPPMEPKGSESINHSHTTESTATVCMCDKGCQDILECSEFKKLAPNQKEEILARSDFTKFLERRCTVWEAEDTVKPSVRNETPPMEPKGSESINHSHTTESTATVCMCDKGCQNILECSKFKKLAPNQKLSRAREMELCYCCLKPKHEAPCEAPKCNHCNGLHHTQLHYGKYSNVQFEKPIPNEIPIAVPITGPIPNAQSTPTQTILTVANTTKCICEIVNNRMCVEFKQNYNFLATAMMLVRNSTGNYKPLRVLFDSASQLSFTTTRATKLLDLDCVRKYVELFGVHESKRTLKEAVKCQFRGTGTNFNGECYAQDDLFYDDTQPAMRIEFDNRRHLLFDNAYFPLSPKSHSMNVTISGNLNDLIARFWTVEKLDVTKSVMTPEEELCEQYYVQRVKFETNGMFIVQLIIWLNPLLLGRLHNHARDQFGNLSYKLQEDDSVAEQHGAVMTEYQDFSPCKRTKAYRIYFIPPFHVMKPMGATTKGKLPIRKFCSNLHQVNAIPSELYGGTLKSGKKDAPKALGVLYQHETDIGTFHHQQLRKSLTQRGITFEVASSFNLLGLISPETVLGKFINQRLRTSRVHWDESVSQSEMTSWFELRQQLVHLSSVKIPRYVFSHRYIKNITLPGFGDACKLFVNAFNVPCDHAEDVFVRLVHSEAKVASSQAKIVTGLEWFREQFMAKLYHKVKPLLPFSVVKTSLSSTGVASTHQLTHGCQYRFRTPEVVVHVAPSVQILVVITSEPDMVAKSKLQSWKPLPIPFGYVTHFISRLNARQNHQSTNAPPSSIIRLGPTESKPNVVGCLVNGKNFEFNFENKDTRIPFRKTVIVSPLDAFEREAGLTLSPRDMKEIVKLHSLSNNGIIHIGGRLAIKSQLERYKRLVAIKQTFRLKWFCEYIRTLMTRCSTSKSRQKDMVSTRKDESTIISSQHHTTRFAAFQRSTSQCMTSVIGAGLLKNLSYK